MKAEGAGRRGRSTTALLAAGLAALLLAGCAATRPLARAAPPEEQEAFTTSLGPRPVWLGVSAQKDGVVLAYDVETQLGRSLSLSRAEATWEDLRDGSQRRVPLEALAWVRWGPTDAPRLWPALKLGGLGLAGGALAGALAGFLAGFGPDTCVGGIASLPPGVGSFGQRCFPDWPRTLGLGAAIGAVVGAAAGALVGAVLGQQEQVELVGPVARPPPPPEAGAPPPP